MIRTPQAGTALAFAGFLAIYLGCAFLGLQLIAPPSHVPLFWPAAGVALAVVVLRGPRWAVLVPVANLAIHLATAGWDNVLPLTLFGHWLAVLAGGWLATRRALRPGTVRHGFQVLLGGALMAALSGLVRGYAMWHAGFGHVSDLALTQLRWGLADLLGVAAVTPLAVLAVQALRHPHAGRRHPGTTLESLLWNIALVASYLLMAWGMSLAQAFTLGLTCLPLAVMLWSALRFSPLRTSLSVALTVTLLALFVRVRMTGFDHAHGTLETVVLLAYLCLLAVLPMVLAFNVSEYRTAARRLLQRASTDPLSGLPNRGAFETQVRDALRDPANVPMAIAYLDLDNLKLVNDTASHRAGDALIAAVANALRARLQPGDRLGHLGGDEFVILLHNVTPTIARERAQGLLYAVDHTRCRYDGEEYGTTASIGLVPFQPEQADFAEILSQADAACFVAKELGGDRVSVAGSAGSALADPTSGMRWTVRIREAVQHGGFLLYAQSIAALQPTRDSGAHIELLLRMRDSRGGTPHLPDRFIPAAERFRLAVRIDREVVKMALAQLEAHPDAAARVSLCAINLSAGALLDEGFVGFVAERLHRSSFPADRLCFEITETSAMRDPNRAQRVIDDLRGLGCRFALDDFGTGFCSFGHLRALDVDYIKIDGSFVRDMETSPLAAEVVRSITRIAHMLHKRTVAEHTESESVRAALAALGVDYAQGFAIDRPQPLDAYLDALARPAGVPS
ncbi:MAG: EAL domain-containing protein [Lysobacter sp.]|nr:EAL domain-containing protein [Lysobacter sp.]